MEWSEMYVPLTSLVYLHNPCTLLRSDRIWIADLSKASICRWDSFSLLHNWNNAQLQCNGQVDDKKLSNNVSITFIVVCRPQLISMRPIAISSEQLSRDVSPRRTISFINGHRRRPASLCTQITKSKKFPSYPFYVFEDFLKGNIDIKLSGWTVWDFYTSLE